MEILTQWRENLRLTNYEKDKFKFELQALDKQIDNLIGDLEEKAIWQRYGL